MGEREQGQDLGWVGGDGEHWESSSCSAVGSEALGSRTAPTWGVLCGRD